MTRPGLFLALGRVPRETPDLGGPSFGGESGRPVGRSPAWSVPAGSTYPAGHLAGGRGDSSRRPRAIRGAGGVFAPYRRLSPVRSPLGWCSPSPFPGRCGHGSGLTRSSVGYRLAHHRGNTAGQVLSSHRSGPAGSSHPRLGQRQGSHRWAERVDRSVRFARMSRSRVARRTQKGLCPSARFSRNGGSGRISPIPAPDSRLPSLEGTKKYYGLSGLAP